MAVWVVWCGVAGKGVGRQGVGEALLLLLPLSAVCVGSAGMAVLSQIFFCLQACVCGGKCVRWGRWGGRQAWQPKNASMENI